MKKLTLTLVAVALGLLVSVPAFAFGPGSGCRGGDGWGPGAGPGIGMGRGIFQRDAVWAKLNLTDEQKAKIESLQIAYQKELRPIREKMFDKSVALRRLWLQATPDKDKITAAQKEVSLLRDEMQGKMTTMRLEIRNVLTPEQQEKLVNTGWGRGMGFGPRGGMRGQGAGGPGICF
jgi:Spy/CpxP family protein refolding chaperone